MNDEKSQKHTQNNKTIIECTKIILKREWNEMKRTYHFVRKRIFLIIICVEMYILIVELMMIFVIFAIEFYFKETDWIIK